MHLPICYCYGSLTYRRNNGGPNTGPCENPDSKGSHLEYLLGKEAFWIRMDAIHQLMWYFVIPPSHQLIHVVSLLLFTMLILFGCFFVHTDQNILHPDTFINTTKVKEAIFMRLNFRVTTGIGSFPVGQCTMHSNKSLTAEEASAYG